MPNLKPYVPSDISDGDQYEKTRQQIMAEHEGQPWGVVEEALVDAGFDPNEEDEQ